MKNYLARDRGFIYFLHCPLAQRIKIGFSKDVKSRTDRIMCGSPLPIVLLKSVPAEFQMEQFLLLLFKKYRTKHEWFESCPELFQLIESLPTGIPLTQDYFIKKILA